MSSFSIRCSRSYFRAVIPSRQLQTTRTLSFKAKHLQMTISDGVVHDEVCRLSTKGSFATKAQDVLGQAQISVERFKDLVSGTGQLLGRLATVASLVDKMAEVRHAYGLNRVLVALSAYVASSVCQNGVGHIFCSV